MGDEREFDRKTFTLSREVIKALAVRAAQDAADGLRSKKKAESEIVEEALRIMLDLPLPKKDDEEGE